MSLSFAVREEIVSKWDARVCKLRALLRRIQQSYASLRRYVFDCCGGIREPESSLRG